MERGLRAIGDGDLHRAHRDGGWTVAQVVSHINVCTLIWLGDLQRLTNDPELRFFFREEIGHDAHGYPPPTTDIAARQIASTRRTLATCLPALDPALFDREVEIPDLGTMTVAEWTPIITGHLSVARRPGVRHHDRPRVRARGTVTVRPKDCDREGI